MSNVPTNLIPTRITQLNEYQGASTLGFVPYVLEGVTYKVQLANITGTVSSVAASGGTTGLSFTGSPITTSGTLTLSGTLGVANGGTGTTTQFTAGSVVFAGASGVYSQDNANLFWDDTNNRLGIGTTGPTNTLEVVSGATNKIRLYNTVGAGNTIDFLDQNWQSQIVGNSGSIVFNAGGTAEAMRIDSAGNVGIGTSSPSRTFSVLSNGLVSTQLATSTSSSYVDIVDGSANAMRIGSFGGIIGIAETLTSTPTLALASGNVGIGTSSPAGKLHVSGAAAGGGVSTTITNTEATGFGGLTFVDGGASVRAQIWVGNGSYASFGGASSIHSSANGGPHIWYTDYSERMRIDSSGNVGIGTSSPGSPLDVQTNSSALGVSIRGRVSDNVGSLALRSSDGATIYGQVQGRSTDFRIEAGSSNVISAYTNSTERLRIDSSGNMLVGTTGTSGSMSNTAKANAGVFQTVSGSVSTASGAATTIASANQNYSQATYIVSCGVSSAAPNTYSAVAIVSADNNVLRITNLQTATNMTISVSGTDIQAQQTSGGTATILYSLIRIA